MHSLKGTFVEEKGFRDTKTEEGSKIGRERLQDLGRAFEKGLRLC
jgi:hypothetical protein